MKNIKVLVFTTVLVLLTSISFGQNQSCLEDCLKNINRFKEVMSDSLSKDQNKSIIEDSIKRCIVCLEAENDRLNTILSRITDLDPLFKDVLPQVLVEDEEVSLELVNHLRNYFSFDDNKINYLKRQIMANNLQIKIIQRPLTERELKSKRIIKPEILGVFLTNDYRIVGTQTVKSVLGQELYTKLQSNEFKTKAGYVPFKKEPKFATTDISVLGGNLTINLPADSALIKVGANVRIGYDILNLPFWYGAVWNISAFYQPNNDEYYMVGTLLPFRPGESKINLVGPVQLKSRKLNGTYGITAEFAKRIFYFNMFKSQFSFLIGGNASYSSLRSRGNEILVDEFGVKIQDEDIYRTPFYSIKSNVLGYISFVAPEFLTGVKLDLGYGSYKVNKSYIERGTDAVLDDDVPTNESFYAKIRYNHEGITKYTVSLQYFNDLYMITGELQLFPFLSIEAKYSRLLGRDPKPWEYNEYVSVSPKIMFSF